ncbi:MAG TPA: hypothetical protein VK440_01760 [Burkholderiales bacterium]|nr:hypothetical protein [Burkholderiales bacterium]
MSESKLMVESSGTAKKGISDEVKPSEKPDWETPKLEDVSEQVMAQPYIRFT